MFEDFKDKIRQHESQKIAPLPLSPKVLSKLRSKGLDPQTVTMKQLFPEVLDGDGNDLSLISGAEWEIMITYAKTRKILLEKYPQTREEANLLGQEWVEEPNDPCQINIVKAREDPLSKVFIEVLDQMKVIYDKIDILQHKASDYEKFCLRFYWHITYNWNHAPDIAIFRNGFQDRDCDLFEIVEAYFKICRKYHVPTLEEPYYFLSEKHRREVKLEGDMLRRSTGYSDNEVRVSMLEAFE